jgi:hypothetical protein
VGLVASGACEEVRGEVEADADVADADVVEVAEPDTAEAVPVPIVEAAGWVRLDDAADPYLSERPADLAPCREEGVITEAGTLEVDTGKCDWATFTQAALRRVEATDHLEIVGWYGNLIAPEPGEGRLVLRIGDRELWDKRVTIPSNGGFILERVVLDGPIEAGTPLLFHVHNHGANTWNLASIDIAVPGTVD